MSLPSNLIYEDRYLAAADRVAWYRSTFQGPLRSTTVGVRQFVERESAEVIVAQRLKRMITIIDKLGRHPSMALSRMQDVGGCRAILPGGRAEVLGVLRRIRRNWDVVRVTDYARNPKPTGYRGVHVIVRRDDRLIEIQLRTPFEHEWAAIVEQTGARLEINLKDGEGPDELVRYFQVAAELLALREEGAHADEVEEQLANLRPLVREYFI